MLYEYLKANYKENEPIFLSDISIYGVSNNNLRQMFKTLCDSNKIKRYDTGIYYIPKLSRLKEACTLPADVVANYKYISRNGEVDGYYSGYTFANQIGVTTQVPYTLEIVTNNASAKYREVTLQGQKLILRKPKVPVTKDNYQILQLLDFLKDIEEFADENIQHYAELIKSYIKKLKLTKEKIDQYISQYPDKIFRIIYEMRLYDVLA